MVKGEQAHLQCSAYGDTPMEISWRMEGQHITGDGDQRYSVREQVLAGGMVSELGIERTLRQDTGIFSCFAANSYGHDEMNIQLTVQEIPEAPRNVRVSEQLSRSIGLSWSPPYAGNTQITSYIIQYKLGLGKSTTLPSLPPSATGVKLSLSDPWPAQPSKVTVPGSQASSLLQNLHAAQVYHIRILAENRLGLSEPSQTVQVSTLEEGKCRRGQSRLGGGS